MRDMEMTLKTAEYFFFLRRTALPFTFFLYTISMHRRSRQGGTQDRGFNLFSCTGRGMKKNLVTALPPEAAMNKDVAAIVLFRSMLRLHYLDLVLNFFTVILYRQDEKNRILSEKRAALPPEPATGKDVATILLRMPDGARLQRRFLATDKLQVYDLYVY
jgi:hypothetical protein